MTTPITFSVERIDSIDPSVDPSYEVRSMTVTARMTEEQMFGAVQAFLVCVGWKKSVEWIARIAEEGL